MYIADYGSKKVHLSKECSENLEKVCRGIARTATGNWRNNHFYIRISEGNGYIRTDIHGLGKINQTNDIAIEDIIKPKNREKYFFCRVLYDFIKGLNDDGYAPDIIDLKMECGIIKDIDMSNVGEDSSFGSNYGLCKVYFE